MLCRSLADGPRTCHEISMGQWTGLEQYIGASIFNPNYEPTLGQGHPIDFNNHGDKPIFESIKQVSVHEREPAQKMESECLVLLLLTWAPLEASLWDVVNDLLQSFLVRWKGQQLTSLQFYWCARAWTIVDLCLNGDSMHSFKSLSWKFLYTFLDILQTLTFFHCQVGAPVVYEAP